MCVWDVTILPTMSGATTIWYWWGLTGWSIEIWVLADKHLLLLLFEVFFWRQWNGSIQPVSGKANINLNCNPQTKYMSNCSLMTSLRWNGWTKQKKTVTILTAAVLFRTTASDAHASITAPAPNPTKCDDGNKRKGSSSRRRRSSHTRFRMQLLE